MGGLVGCSPTSLQLSGFKSRHLSILSILVHKKSLNEHKPYSRKGFDLMHRVNKNVPVYSNFFSNIWVVLVNSYN
jgi:hypothetical protein